MNTMEETLLSPVLNRGTDNVFANADGVNINNIQRMDFIFDDGLVVSPDPDGEGFVILERGGNDDFRIAAITGLDSNGNPNSFGTIVDVLIADWENSQFSFATDVLASDSPADDLVRTVAVSSQPLAGVYVFKILDLMKEIHFLVMLLQVEMLQLTQLIGPLLTISLRIQVQIQKVPEVWIFLREDQCHQEIQLKLHTL